ncbi:hypothetical protein ERHA55_31850 [Erwinia rhapontici]|nr:hypothetical protein ERHA55_31850 [Erwinia rhapontici]
MRSKLTAALLLMLAAGAARADTTLTIATIANGDMTIMQQLSGTFEQAHPGIHLRWQVMDDAELRKQVLAAMNSGQPTFDVITVGTYEAPLWGKRGWLTPLDALPADYQVDDLLKPVRKALSWQDKLFALPFYGESSMTYYRKDLFAAHGLTMPEEVNWSDIKRLAAKLTDKANGVYGLCLRGRPGWGITWRLSPPWPTATVHSGSISTGNPRWTARSGGKCSATMCRWCTTTARRTALRTVLVKSLSCLPKASALCGSTAPWLPVC